MITEDEVPPSIRHRVVKEEMSKEEFSQFCGKILYSTGEILCSVGELDEVMDEIKEDIPLRIARSLALEMSKIMENALTAAIACAEISGSMPEEEIEGMQDLLLQTRKQIKDLKD